MELSDSASTSILLESAVLASDRPAVPVQQALGAIGEPETLLELGQRLVTTVSLLWSDVAGADLFLPHGPAHELRGVCDPVGGHALMSAIAVARDGSPDVRIVPSTPHLVAGDAGLGFGSTLSAPIDGAETWAGFLIVQRRPSAPEFTARDLDGLARLARGVSAILARVQARGGQATALWFQNDLASAREMQRMFLPRPLESNSAGARVLAEYLPAFAVGGDFYDFIDLGGGRLLAAIGDVSGKGVTGALMMSRISSELRRLAAEGTGPGQILARLNGSLPGRMQDDRFVTVVCVLLDMPNRRWTVANAGHVVPLLRRASGAVCGLAYASGPPIGMMPDASYDEEVFVAEPGDILLLATDGVFELFAGHRRPCSTMGQCRLADVVQSATHDLAEIHKTILSAVEKHAHGRDDVALLGLELPA
ncbi:MAG TPA: PP2C family protein-serine/threonine phosphatase [Polyangia bacterium]|nr:PP2C family protein-serine/threonine phosphatase [Polyangia bacterium]